MKIVWQLLLLALAALTTASANAAQPAAAAASESKTATQPSRPALEVRAIELLKATSRRLAAAHALSFTAVISYESPSRLGPPLLYTSKSEVLLQRPDKLRVLTLGDGPASEFYYDGKTVMAFAPAENLVAVSSAPPTLAAMLQTSFDTHGTYFPFTDFIVADPYRDMANGLERAFYMGQSHVVGGTVTDMVGIVTNGVFEQIWIGAEDKLPRRARAVFLNDPAQLRHDMELSNWRIDPAVAAGAFVSAKAAAAPRMPFESSLPSTAFPHLRQANTLG